MKQVSIYLKLVGLCLALLSHLPVSLAGERIEFVHEFELSDYSGQTYLNFMKTEVKPAMDDLALNGYKVKGKEAIQKAYDLSDRKIQKRVEGKWGGLSAVKSIAEALQFQTQNLNNLPSAIWSQQPGIDSYGLSTFIGLASGGGVAISYNEENVGYNVHYDTVEERSGRSFGVGPTRRANDASDANYLRDIQEYLNEADANNYKEFYKTLFQALLNSDPSNYSNMTPFGQTVLTDFLSVYTAEQARNLMDDDVRPHWDAALLEVTLLGAFHSGQNEFTIYYKNPETRETTFTATTLKQSRCKYPSKAQKATMVDYWQFSRRVDNQDNCGRSGINITKKEFRQLGKSITRHLYDKNRSLFYKLKKSMGIPWYKPTYNLYEALSYYIISNRTPKSIDADKIDAITDAWVTFIEFSNKEAQNITNKINN